MSLKHWAVDLKRLVKEGLRRVVQVDVHLIKTKFLLVFVPIAIGAVAAVIAEVHDSRVHGDVSLALGGNRHGSLWEQESM